MQRLIPAFVGLCVGVLAGFLVGGSCETTPTSEAARTRSSGVSEESAARAVASRDEREIASLRDRLAEETARANRLVVEIADLRDPPLDTLPGPDDPGSSASTRAETGEDTSSEANSGDKQRTGLLDEDILREAGFHPSELEALRSRFERIELDRLFIRDQATREGWRNKPRYRKLMARLRERYDGLREEFGDEDYDWILYAAGRPNRVSATLVMEESPAADVGIESGDVFIAYDGLKVLTPRELQAATTTGNPGETVAVDVLRDGEELRFYVPVGPLGVQLAPVRSRPLHSR